MSPRSCRKSEEVVGERAGIGRESRGKEVTVMDPTAAPPRLGSCCRCAVHRARVQIGPPNDSVNSRYFKRFEMELKVNT